MIKKQIKPALRWSVSLYSAIATLPVALSLKPIHISLEMGHTMFIVSSCLRPTVY